MLTVLNSLKLLFVPRAKPAPVDRTGLCGMCPRQVEASCIRNHRAFLCEDCFRGQPSRGDGMAASSLRKARLYMVEHPTEPGRFVDGPFRHQIDEWARKAGAGAGISPEEFRAETLTYQKQTLASVRAKDNQSGRHPGAA